MSRSGTGALILSLSLLAAAAPAAADLPVPPCNLIAKPAGPTSIELVWEDVANNETKYLIEQRVGSTFRELEALDANTTAATVIDLSPAHLYTFRVRTQNAEGFSPYTPEVSGITDAVGSPSACTSVPTALCVNNDRFQLQVEWRTGTANGIASGQKIGDDSAAFPFFGEDNQELLVKVLNACGVNNRYWVFFSATTNVEFTVTVTDTQTGRSRSYFNPLNRPAPPVQDTSAFATCP